MTTSHDQSDDRIERTMEVALLPTIGQTQHAAHAPQPILELILPYPPSTNHYWRRVGAKTLISREGRAFRRLVCAILAARGIQPREGLLDVVIHLYPPDRRRRDVDNAQKALLDALAHGGAYHDDSQIVHLETWKREPSVGGKTIVRISAYGD